MTPRPAPDRAAADATRWDQLARDVAAVPDQHGWLAIDVEDRRCFLMRAALGDSTVVVAHTMVLADVDAVDAAAAGGAWPLGAIVLARGRWLARHSFLGVPSAGQVLDVLRCLVRQARALEPEPIADASAFLHYAL
jgi:hypothetical protein